jgi:hypothetical protein
MPVNSNDVGESAFQKAPRSNRNPYGPSRRGPASLPSPDDVGSHIDLEQGIPSPNSGIPAHRKAGAVTPENNQSRDARFPDR